MSSNQGSGGGNGRNWNAAFGSTYYSPTNPTLSNANSTTRLPLNNETSNTNNDPLSALIGIVSGNITSSMSEIKTNINEVKTENANSTKEIKEKIDSMPKNNTLAESIFNPATLAVLGVLLIIVICFIIAGLNSYTGIKISDVKDYILLFGGGLVGLLGGDKIKKADPSTQK